MRLCLSILFCLIAFYFDPDIRNIPFSNLNLSQLGRSVITIMSGAASAYFLVASLAAGERAWPWRWSQHPAWPYVFWHSTAIVMLLIIQFFFDGRLRIALIGLLLLFMYITLADLYKAYRAARNQ